MLSARWLPSGAVTSEPVTACSDAACSQMLASPADLLVPAGATAVELWFHTGGRTCTSAYDSNFGRNYRFEVAPRAPAAVGWAGDWGSSFARDCARRDGIAEPVVVDGYTRERACAIAYADVWAPGVTDTAAAHTRVALRPRRVAPGRRPLAGHPARGRRPRRQQPALPLGPAQDRAGLRHLVRAHVHVPVLHRRPGVPEHRPGQRRAPHHPPRPRVLSLTPSRRVPRVSGSRSTSTPRR
jgi:hypothetical protein